METRIQLIRAQNPFWVPSFYPRLTSEVWDMSVFGRKAVTLDGGPGEGKRMTCDRWL